MREIIRNRKKIIKQWSKNGPRGLKVKNFLSRVRGVLFPWTPYVLGRGEGMSAGRFKNQTFFYFLSSPFPITPCIVRWGGGIADGKKADEEKNDIRKKYLMN